MEEGEKIIGTDRLDNKTYIILNYPNGRININYLLHHVGKGSYMIWTTQKEHQLISNHLLPYVGC